MKKLFLKRLLLLLPGIAAWIVTVYAQYHPGWTEQVYSLSLYPGLSAAVAYLPSLLGFALTEWLVILFILFCLGYIVSSIRKVVKTKKGRSMAVYRGAAGAAAIFSMLFFVFTALCGLNYHRYTFTYYTGYDMAQSSAEELEQLCTSLAGEMDHVRKQLGEDTDLFTAGPGDFESSAEQSVLAVQTLAAQYPVLERPLYSTPKPVVLSPLMSLAGISGVFVPFTMESNINRDVPYFMYAATMTHELAHQSGFMREDEANFIAYLACTQSDDPMMLYSGLFLALDRSMFVLEEVDPDLAVKISAALSPAVRRDRAQYEQFWASHESFITDISRSVIDSYLKANNQAAGVSSYDRMVDLLLAEQRTAKGRS